VLFHLVMPPSSFDGATHTLDARRSNEAPFAFVRHGQIRIDSSASAGGHDIADDASKSRCCLPLDGADGLQFSLLRCSTQTDVM
jgi:hypothetical protein